MSFFLSTILFCATLVLGLTGCGTQPPSRVAHEVERVLTLPAFDESSAQVTRECAEQRNRLEQRLAEVGGVSPDKATFESTTRAIEEALADFHAGVELPEFYVNVSPDPKVRDASELCKNEDAKLTFAVWTREDLYQAVKAFDLRLKKGEVAKLSDREDAKLHHETLLSFKRSGMELSPETRRTYVAIQSELVQLSSAFIKALGEDKAYVEATDTQLKGLPGAFVTKLWHDSEKGTVRIPANEAAYPVVMGNAEDVNLRREMAIQFRQRGGIQNVKRLKRAIELRAELAKLLGYPTFADYATEIKMAGSARKVNDFLTPLVAALKGKGREELKQFQAMKEAATGDASPIESWDIDFYKNRMREAQGVDSEEVRQYFPVDVVVPGMFDIYGTLLGVKFVEAPDLKVWHPSVKAYRIQREGKTLAVFYLDLFPRPGKYSHASSMGIIPAYQLLDGRYHAPSSAIVANFNPGDATHPALLSHDEVQLLFHEFGHIMHGTLTTVRYESLSGGNVRLDFVEAPSQMMENWVWNEEGLNRLSGYYLDHTRKLPTELVQKLLSVRNIGVALTYLRQLSYATLDMELHTSDGRLDPDTVFNDAMRDISLVPEPTGGHGVASFQHLMHGYEAGYYGYVYSKVFADDMFAARFEGHLLDPIVGADYLHSILEPGGTVEPLQLVEDFLRRAPDNRAFLHSIGVN